MNTVKAIEQLAKHNIVLQSLTEAGLEDIVYGKGASTEMLIRLNTAARTLSRARVLRDKAVELVTETFGALKLRAFHGDVAATEYMTKFQRSTRN